ncbi:MAG: hypothetical protein KBD04_04025 [Proteobacteria bacterium]|nr:hypothetical protein [Pseudomonadota bacterium]
MKSVFFVLFVCAYIFPVAGMNAEEPLFQAAAPGTPIRQAPVVDLNPYVADLSNLLAISIEQIKNVHKIFSGEIAKESQPKIRTKKIKDFLIKRHLLENVFIPHFRVARTQRFTPECKKSLGTHLKDIDGNSPKKFLRKGTADFVRSVDLEDFYTIETHERNTFFLLKSLVNPESGFGLYRSRQNTISFEGVPGSPTYGIYNILKLLEAENPETHSGVVEFHHVYQNPEVITIVPYGEHKGSTVLYHKSKKDSRIDRASSNSEFYYLKKLIGLIQVAKMCSYVLRDCNDLGTEVLNEMSYIDSYAGNLRIIPNPGAEKKQKQKYTVEMAFSTHLALAPHGHDEEDDREEVVGDQLIMSGFGLNDSDLDSAQTDLSGSGTEGHTSHSELDSDDSNTSFVPKRALDVDFRSEDSNVSPSSLSPITPLSPVRSAKKMDKKPTPSRIGKENIDSHNTSEFVHSTADEQEDFPSALLGKNSYSLFAEEGNIPTY